MRVCAFANDDFVTFQKHPLTWRPEYEEDTDENVFTQAWRPPAPQSRT